MLSAPLILQAQENRGQTSRGSPDRGRRHRAGGPGF